MEVPANNVLEAGTVPANNVLGAGTVPANNHIHIFIQQVMRSRSVTIATNFMRCPNGQLLGRIAAHWLTYSKYQVLIIGLSLTDLLTECLIKIYTQFSKNAQPHSC